MSALGEPLDTFARRELCEPLGIMLRRWDRDPGGVPMGGAELWLTPRDLLRLGALYLNGGEIDGRRLLPAGWVRESYRNARPPGGHQPGFGYSWWLFDTTAGPLAVAYGHGGQALAVFPGTRVSLVITCDPDNTSRAEESVREFLVDDIAVQIAGR